MDQNNKHGGFRIRSHNHQKNANKDAYQRLFNIHQGFSPFLDQISHKDAMSLVNELCHLHKIKPEYELTDVQGPENAKLFTGVSEKHNGQGSSIKNAQRNAAWNALQKTRLNFPMQRKPNRTNNTKNAQITEPFNELNTLFMKNGIHPRYELNKMKDHQNQPDNPIDHNVLPMAYQSCCCRTLQPTIYYYNIPASITYFYPSCYYDPYTNKNYIIYELVNPGYINIPTVKYSPQSTLISKSKVKIESEISEEQLNEHLFSANIEFDGIRLSGYGKSSQEARRMATERALDYLKKNLFNTLTITTSQSCHKNPITLVYTIAARNRLRVSFDLIDCYGPVHIPVFVFHCRMYDSKNGKQLFQTEGKDHSKKSAKRLAAQNMLDEIENKNLSDIFVPKSKSTSNENVLVSEKLVKINENNEVRKPESNQDLSSNEILDFVSNKSLTLFYDLARNMSLQNPLFHYLPLNQNNPITKRFVAMMKFDPGPNQIYCVESILFFDQVTPQKLHCTIKALGFSLTQRIAKQISAFICLLKMGIEPPQFDQNDHLFVQSLQFSLNENSNFSKDINEKIKSFIHSQKLYVFYKNVSEQDYDLEQNTEFKINYQFVLFILKKFYYYTLKDSKKHVSVIEEKIKFLLSNFKKNYNYEFDHFDEKSIQNLISNLNMQLYWHHLQLLSNLLVMGIKNLETKTFLVMNFKCHTCNSDTSTDINSNFMAFVSVQLNNFLNRENFDLIQKHYVTYGFGSDEDQAREAASLRTLHNLATNSFKHFIESRKEEKPGSYQVPKEEEPVENLDDKKIQSRPSSNQIKSKQCLSYMFQVCRDIFVRKPDFVYHKWDKPIEPNVELFCSRCIIHFKQDFNKFHSKLVILGISTSKRLSRTITAYIFLSMINISNISLSTFDVFNIPDFEKYLKYSIEQNENHLIINRIFPPIINKIFYEEEQRNEIYRNLEFVQYLLKEVYKSFLKNQKRNDLSCLFFKIKNKLFEYHNHRKQIMDQSKSFDRWSEHIKQWIHNSMAKFDGQKYWDHLQLISLICSTLNYNLNEILDPMVFDFKCQLIKVNFETGENEQSEKKDSVEKGTIAIITLHCSSVEFIENCPLLQKEVLSFSMDSDEQEAREFASYKALRYLAINLWKSHAG